MASTPQLTVGLGFDLDEASAKKVEKGMERVGASLEKSASESASKLVQTWRTKLNSLGNDFESIGMRLSASLSLPFALLGAKIIEATRDYDRLKQSLTAIEGTSEKMGKRLELLTEIAKAPGIGFEQAIQGDVRLRAVGISAEVSANALIQFANAISFTGGTASQFDLVTYQLGQMSASARVMGNDLRPIIEQAPAVAGALKQMFGTTKADDIAEKLGAMGKSPMQFIEMLVEKLKEIPRVKGGFNNAIENMGIAIKGFFANIGESLFSAVDLEGILKGIEGVLNNLAESIKNLSPEAKKFILVIAGLSIIAPPILLALGAITIAIGAISAPVLAVVAVVAASMYLILEHWEGLGKTLSRSSFFSGFSSLFGGMFEIIANLMSTFGNLFTGNWAALGENIKNIVKGLNNAIIGIFQIIIGTVGKGMAQLFSMVGMDSVAKGISGGTSAFLEFAEKSKFALTGTTNKVKELGKSVSDLFKNNPNKPKDPKDDKVGGEKTRHLVIDLAEIAQKSKDAAEQLSKVNEKIAEFNFQQGRKVTPMGQARKLDNTSSSNADKKDFFGDMLGISGVDLENSTKKLENRLEVLKDRIKGLGGTIQEEWNNFRQMFSELDLPEFPSQTKLFDKLGINVLDGINDAEIMIMNRFMLMQDTLKNVMFEIGNSLGELFTGIFESVFDKDVKFDFKKVLASFLKSMGQMLISMGTAVLAAGKLFTLSVLTSVEGVKSIKSGLGLIALGGALSAGGNVLGRSGDSPSQSKQYDSTFTAPAQGSSNQNNKVEFVIQGTTLKGVLNNVNNSFG